MRQQFSTLDAAGLKAWHLFTSVCSRFNLEMKTAAAVLVKLTEDMTPDEFRDLTDRLSLLYHVIHPLKKSDGA